MRGSYRGRGGGERRRGRGGSYLRGGEPIMN